MRAKTNVLLDSRVPEVVLEHNGESLVFSINVFKRENFLLDYEVFEYMNRYWESLPETKQYQIFQSYRNISKIFDIPTSNTNLQELLLDAVRDLMEYHKLEDIKNWVYSKSNIIIPENIPTDYVHNIELNTTRQKTYTRSDYMELIVLSVAMKAMIPVWGEFINHVRQNVGTIFKEYFAFLLLGQTEIIKCHAVQRLKTYIESFMTEANFKPSNTLNGISSEDYSFWMLSIICLRRLCLADIRGTNDSQNLATITYKYIYQKTHIDDTDFKNKIKDKEFNGESGESSGRSDKLSFLEIYKNKADLSIGAIVSLENSMSRIDEIVNRLSINCPKEFVYRSIETSKGLVNYNISDAQITLLRWVFKPVISAKGILYLPKEQLVTLLGVTEAVLWTRGFKYLALLATSYNFTMESTDIIISPVDSKMRVSDELVQKLDVIYPFISEPSLRKNVKKALNPAMVSIDNLANTLIQATWRSTAHDDMLIEVFGNNSRKIPIVPDIKEQLTKLVISIGERSWI